MKKIIIFSLLVVFSTSLGMKQKQLVISCGVSVDQGNTRKTQEDLVVVNYLGRNNSILESFFSVLNTKEEKCVLTNKKMSSFLGAVYDGHRGSDAVLYVQQNLFNNFINNLNDERTMQNCFLEAFKKTEQDLKQIVKKSGAVATVLCVKGDTLGIGNLGDCRAVIACPDGRCLATEDLSTKNSKERARINSVPGGKAEEGFPSGAYLVHLDNTSLPVSAALGNHDIDPNKKYLRVVPDYYEVKDIQKNCNFVIMASDGLWDMITNEDAVATVYEKLQDEWSLEKIAEELKNNAITKGSTDNISVVIVKLSENIIKPQQQHKSELLIPIKSNFNIISFIINPWVITIFSIAALFSVINCYGKFHY